MDNKEDILDALEEFNRKPQEKVPPLLEQYLCRIAMTGETLFPWSKLKPLFVHKMDMVMQEFHEHVPTDESQICPNVENIKFADMRLRLLDSINTFTGAPFTIQRLCELITNPTKHYKRTDKFLRGIEKNVIVVSSVDPFGNKIVNESSKLLVNGLDSNGYDNNKQSPDTTQLSPFMAPPAPMASPIGNNGTSTSGNTSWFGSPDFSYTTSWPTMGSLGSSESTADSTSQEGNAEESEEPVLEGVDDRLNTTAEDFSEDDPNGKAESSASSGPAVKEQEILTETSTPIEKDNDMDSNPSEDSTSRDSSDSERMSGMSAPEQIEQADSSSSSSSDSVEAEMPTSSTSIAAVTTESVLSSAKSSVVTTSEGKVSRERFDDDDDEEEMVGSAAKRQRLSTEVDPDDIVAPVPADDNAADIPADLPETEMQEDIAPTTSQKEALLEATQLNESTGFDTPVKTDTEENDVPREDSQASSSSSDSQADSFKDACSQLSDSQENPPEENTQEESTEAEKLEDTPPSEEICEQKTCDNNEVVSESIQSETETKVDSMDTSDKCTDESDSKNECAVESSTIDTEEKTGSETHEETSAHEQGDAPLTSTESKSDIETDSQSPKDTVTLESGDSTPKSTAQESDSTTSAEGDEPMDTN